MREVEALIIGASAAGMSAAIYLKRREVNFILLSKDIGGEMLLSGEIDNYPGIVQTNGFELTKKFEEHLKHYDIQPILGYKVISIKKEKDNFIVEADNDKGEKMVVKTKSLIITTGSKPKKLNVPGEEKYYLKGVSYCTVCDGPLFKNKKVAVIGGGNSALEAALMLSELCPQVWVLTKNEDMKGDEVLKKNFKQKKNIKLITLGLTKEIFGNDFVKGLVYIDLKSEEDKRLEVDGIFVHIGMSPNTDFVPDELGIKNNYGEIVVNKLAETSQPGIFAAGDVTDIPYKQIGIAVGQGITAALSCVNFLNRK